MTEQTKRRGRPRENPQEYGIGAPVLHVRLGAEVYEYLKARPEGPRAFLEEVVRAYMKGSDNNVLIAHGASKVWRIEGEEAREVEGSPGAVEPTIDVEHCLAMLDNPKEVPAPVAPAINPAAPLEDTFDLGDHDENDPDLRVFLYDGRWVAGKKGDPRWPKPDESPALTVEKWRASRKWIDMDAVAERVRVEEAKAAESKRRFREWKKEQKAKGLPTDV